MTPRAESRPRLLWEIREGDALERLREMPDGSVHCCVTSPPYWGLRDYGVPGQLGREPTPEEYVAHMVEVFREVRRVLREDGVMFLNLGDSYAATGKSGGGSQGARWERAGHVTEGPRGGRWSPAPPGLKPKDLVGIPWRVAFALQADGWWLRSDIIWAKPNPMPESVRDRPTKAHEYVFLLTKAERYFYDADAVAEDATCGPRGSEFHVGKTAEHQMGRSQKVRPFRAITATRNRRTVWTITTKPYSEAHFATFPPELPEVCIKAGCPEGGTVLDPFSGAGTTGMVALRLGRAFVGIELNPEYAEMARRRIYDDAPLLNGGAA